ncbi:MAG: twin-arginine translocation signal domain-containing protein, partial [Azoarcus sp.]|nr:twin-arginine translocation signal domain-containing protein [Azoarcus sp.]
MERRSFLKKAGVGLAAGAVVAPAIAQDLPTIKWRLASSFPKSLDTLHGSGEYLVNRISEMSNGKFQIQLFAAGELVPSAGVLDAVKDGTVEIGFTCSYYYFGKDPTFCIDTAIPF